MKVTQHGDNLIQMTKWRAFNCYLVREKDGLTLVDALMPGDGQAILQVARDLGQPIRRIALTHAHSDHVGALDELVEALPEADLLLTGRTQKFLQGQFNLEPGEADAKIKGSFPRRQARATRLLNADAEIGSLRLIPSPGHSPDHSAYFDSRDGALIAGDAFQTKGGIAVAGKLKLLFPFPALATWHEATARRSAQKLLDLGPTRLAVGHGPVLTNPAPAMQNAIAAAS